MRPNRPVGSAAATLLATTWLLPLAAFALPLPASALPLRRGRRRRLRAGFASLATVAVAGEATATAAGCLTGAARSEEHTSELQSLMRISYAVFCLKKKKKSQNAKRITIKTAG